MTYSFGGLRQSNRRHRTNDRRDNGCQYRHDDRDIQTGHHAMAFQHGTIPTHGKTRKMGQ